MTAQTLLACEACSQTFERPSMKGRAPSLCPGCRADRRRTQGQRAELRRGSVKSARYAARKAAGVTAASQACQGCGEVKPASEYRNNWHRPSGLDYFCHECESAKKRESIHGVSQTEYEAKLAAQGGVCAICRRPEMTRANKGDRLKCLAQDHNHNTGQRRGLLCANCNKGIGNLGDDPERLIAAAAYLIEYAAVEGG